jgi:hypothetical protein
MFVNNKCCNVLINFVSEFIMYIREKKTMSDIFTKFQNMAIVDNKVVFV